MIEILEKENLPYVEPEYRPPPKPPRIQDNTEERIWPHPKPHNLKNTEEKEKKIWNYRPPPNPPNIENINEEKKWDCKPPPEPPPILLM